MNPRGFVDPALVPVCGRLASRLDVFERELRALAQADFVPWFDIGVYAGEWVVFPLVARLDPLPPGFDLQRCRQLCPQSAAVLSAEPQVLLAGFSRLLPGTVVHPHTDRPGAHVLRFHLGLVADAGCALAFGGDRRSSERGRGVLFDHSMIHSSHNHSTRPRDLLLVDVRLTPAEIAAVRASRGAVHFGATADGAGTA
jgi:beta-hydroxylase